MARSNKYTSLNFNDIYEKKIVNNNNNNNTSNTNNLFSSSTSKSSYLSSATKSYSGSAASRLTHGGMLVLSRPSPKPLPQPQPQPPQQQSPITPPLSPSPKQQPSSILLTPAAAAPPSVSPAAKTEGDVISLRPQGKTGGGGGGNGGTNLPLLSPPTPGLEAGLSGKSSKFVPPHLRPGYVAKEVAPTPPPPSVARPGNYRPGSAQENGRPKSGGGFVNHNNHGPPSHNNQGYYHGYQENGRPKSGGGYIHQNQNNNHGYYHGMPNQYQDNGRPKSGGGYYHGTANNHGSPNYHGYANHGSPSNYNHGYYQGSPNRYPEGGRPKSGGGYDRQMRGIGGGGVQNPNGGESNFLDLNRPRSGDFRPGSSG